MVCATCGHTAGAHNGSNGGVCDAWTAYDSTSEPVLCSCRHYAVEVGC